MLFFTKLLFPYFWGLWNLLNRFGLIRFNEQHLLGRVRSGPMRKERR